MPATGAGKPGLHLCQGSAECHSHSFFYPRKGGPVQGSRCFSLGFGHITMPTEQPEEVTIGTEDGQSLENSARCKKPTSKGLVSSDKTTHLGTDQWFPGNGDMVRQGPGPVHRAAFGQGCGGAL